MQASFLRRKSFSKAGLAIAASILALGAAPAAAQQVINIDAHDPNGEQILSLGAGTYSVNLIGTADGGAYNAWNPWGYTTCSSPGTNCTGWIDDFGITYADMTSVYVNGVHYLTETDALAANQANIANGTATFNPNDAGITNSGGTLLFTLLVPTDVTFSIFDAPYSDNQGGVSLSLSSVQAALPEPATWAMILLGFAGIGFELRRRRARSAVANA